MDFGYVRAYDQGRGKMVPGDVSVPALASPSHLQCLGPPTSQGQGPLACALAVEKLKWSLCNVKTSPALSNINHKNPKPHKSCCTIYSSVRGLLSAAHVVSVLYWVLEFGWGPCSFSLPFHAFSYDHRPLRIFCSVSGVPSHWGALVSAALRSIPSWSLSEQHTRQLEENQLCLPQAGHVDTFWAAANILFRVLLLWHMQLEVRESWSLC